MKDRLSVHVDNGQTDILEAVTVLRNGGTVAQSGLVGITNIQYQPTSDTIPSAILPETIFNIQASGKSELRSTAISNGARSKIELLTTSNTPASGTSISYKEPHGASGSFEISNFDDYGKELSFFVYQSGTVAIGDIRSYTNSGDVFHDLSAIDGRSVLLVSKSGDPYNSGTIAIRSQLDKPSGLADFGKLYVKSYNFNVDCEEHKQHHALYFVDASGNEQLATPNMSDSKGGLVFGGSGENTYAGYNTPRDRVSCKTTPSGNTLFGHGIDIALDRDAHYNTVVGYRSGSGISGPMFNTVVGADSFNHLLPSSGNVILGYNSLTKSVKDLTDVSESVDNAILIGNNLFLDDIPNDYTLAIGQNTPIITGLLKGSERKVSIISSDSENTKFTLNKDPYDFNFGIKYENNRFVGVIGSQDQGSSSQARQKLVMRFQNSQGHEQTLVDYDPIGAVPVTNPVWEIPNPQVPTVSISGDLRVLGSIRFPNGTSLGGTEEDNSDTVAFRPYYGLVASGIKRSIINNDYYFGLDFDSVPLASDFAGGIEPSQTFVGVDIPGGFGKVNIPTLGAYITSGTATFAENCNAVYTNPDNVAYIKPDKNFGCVFIGCDTATSATGWKHGVFIGTQAGYKATTPNASLATDTACIFIGYNAGFDAANVNDTICIGNSAGKNSDGSNKSIFIGPNAGENATNPNCIGIGAHALGGEVFRNEGGQRNIEIVAGLDDHQRLMYASGAFSDKLNIQNTIAGNTQKRQISIGHANLTPQAPLEVVRDTTDFGVHDGHTTENIQRWINEGTGIARVNESGAFIQKTVGNNYSSETGTCDSWFGTHEGFMNDYIYAPTSYTSPTSGWMTTRTYENGFGTDRRILVVNRDPRLNIHGPGAVGGTAFVVTMMVNGEHRPVFVSCSGT